MNRKRGFGWEPDAAHPDDRFHAPRVGRRGVPGKFDLRDRLPQAWDQGAIQSCTAHAVGAALWVLHPKAMPSRLALYWHARAVRGTVPTDSGAMLRHAVEGVRRGGLVPEAAWPYRPVAPRGRHGRFPHGAAPVLPPPAGEKADVAGFRVHQDLDALRACIAEGFPVVFGLWVPPGFRDAAGRWRRVMPAPVKGVAPLGGHAVAAVGYDDARRCFLIRNSFGKQVQERGHFWLPYGLILRDDLAVDFWTLPRV